MDLPRIDSQTSICPPNIQLLTDHKTKPSASQRLLTANTSTEPQFAVLPSAPVYQPSRRREEACALQNLRRRLQAVKIMEANRPEPTYVTYNNNSSLAESEDRPNLLQKILHNRPVSMLLDASDLRTAWQDSDFISDCICWHNVYRQRHNSPCLTMSSELCYLAQTWANHLAHTNKFYYRNDKDIGQNLYCKLSNFIDSDLTGQEVASYWYCGVKQYDFRKEPDVLHTNSNSGHFTQLIWSSSRHFGIGKATSRSGKIVIVAHYSPAGNISGHYLTNVLPPYSEYPGMTQTFPPRFTVASESTGSTSTNSLSEMS